MEEKALFPHFQEWLRQPRVFVPLLLLAAVLVAMAVLTSAVQPPPSTPAGAASYPAPRSVALSRAQPTGAPVASPSGSDGPPPRVELHPSVVQPGYVWLITTVDPQRYTGYGTSLALDRQDRPHISYYAACALRYAWHDGAAWHLEIVDSGCVNQRGIGKDASLFLDAADRPHISYYDDAHYELRYACFDGTRWLTETVEAGGIGTGAQTGLALDAQGRPHISYRGNSYYLRYARLIELPYTLFLPRIER